MGGCLGAALFWVDSVRVPLDDILDDAVLAERLLIGLMEGPLGIGLVFSEQQIDIALAVEEVFPKQRMPSRNATHVLTGIENSETWFLFVTTPRPGIAKPERWQHMDRGR